MTDPSSDSLLSRLARTAGALMPASWRRDIPVVPVVRLSGAIGMSTPFNPGLSLATVSRNLERAFAVKKAPAVALIINSPGGSPVQSHLIFKRIRSLAKEKDKHVFAFVEDVAASGGYMIACAADEIFADPSSVVGSIGVVSAGFGFDRLIDRIGVERRVHTAGTRKVMLDPFRPERPEDVERLLSLQADVHRMFIALVRERRAGTLNGPEEALFSGEFWVGTQAEELGLIDDLGDLRTVLRTRYGDKVRTPLIAAGGWWPRRVGIGSGRLEGLAPAFGAGLADAALARLEERALWSRYGL